MRRAGPRWPRFILTGRMGLSGIWKCCSGSDGPMFLAKARRTAKRSLDRQARRTFCQPRASGFVSLLVGATFRADLADGFIDDALDFIRVGTGVPRPDVL